MSRDGPGRAREGRPRGLGVLLRDWRERALLTQEELAARAGLSVRTVRRLERGEGGAAAHLASIRLLADALGLDDGQRQAFVAAARGTEGPAAPERARPVPRQLPPDIETFTGRALELKLLDNLVRQSTAARTTIVVVTGMAGVGKTALTVHWAHSVLDRFPDGQLHLDLQGFGPSGDAVEPPAALRTLLAAWGVRPEQIPAGLDAQVGLYRSLLADRRVLVVLDNARDAAQIRPLLPGGADCFVVVTSRSELSGLVAVESAHPVPLDAPSLAEARDLFAARVGWARVEEDPAAVDEISRLCGRLPLALAVAAARAVMRSELPLRAVADDLRASMGTLDGFDIGDLRVDVRAVLSWSYRALAPGPARLFRMLGLSRGPTVSPAAVASLIAVPEARTRAQLAELAHAHLVVQEPPGRYGFHDLLRAYAGELVEQHDGPDDRTAAVHRLFDHYVHSAYRAVALLEPLTSAVPLADPPPGVSLAPVADFDGALRWFRDEHSALLAAIRQAGALGFDAHVGALARATSSYLDRQGHWQDWADVQRLALASVERTSDRLGKARAHGGLARALTRLGHFDDAKTHFLHARELFDAEGDGAGRAITALNLGWLHECMGDYAAALVHHGEAHDLFTAIGHRAGQGRARNALGSDHAHLGRLQEALHLCRDALAVQEEIADRFGQAETWDTLGYAHRALGDDGRAEQCYETSNRIYTALGDRGNEAVTLVSLGELAESAGDRERAVGRYRRALAIMTELDHPEAQQVRDRLADLVPG